MIIDCHGHYTTTPLLLKPIATQQKGDAEKQTPIIFLKKV